MIERPRVGGERAVSESQMAVFAGNANPTLALDIAKHLMLPLGRAHVGHFSDGEVTVELMDNVRGRDVFIVQPTCPPATNDHLMELLLMADACRRASAGRIGVDDGVHGRRIPKLQKLRNISNLNNFDNLARFFVELIRCVCAH